MEEMINNLIKEGYEVRFSPAFDPELVDVNIYLDGEHIAFDYGVLPEALSDAYVQVPERKPESTP